MAKDGKDASDAAFTSILSNNPNLATEHPDDFARVQLGLTSYYEDLGKHREAIEAAKKGIAVACRDRNILIELKIRLAFNYRMVKDYAGSIAQLEALARDYPEHASAWQLDVVKVYEDQGRYKEAIAVLDKIGDTYREERESVLYAKAGLLVRQMADYENGIRVAETFLTDYPDSVHTEAVKGMLVLALGKLGRQQEADAFSKTASHKAKETDYKSIEDMLYIQNQPAQAREACKKLQNAGAGSRDARLEFLSANCIYVEGNWSTARDAFQSFYDHYPVGKYHAQAKYYIGDCCMRLEDKAAGQKAFQEIAEAFSNTLWSEVAMSRLIASE